MFPRSNRNNSKMACTTFGYTGSPSYQAVFCAAMTLAMAVAPVYANVGLSLGEKTAAAECTPSDSGKQTKSSSSSVEPDFYLIGETAVDRKLFEDRSFNIRSVVKASVKYHKAGDELHETAYEDLWYHNGKPLALERSTVLDIPSDKKVAIKILLSPCAPDDEVKAAANLILRLVLDIRLNNDTVSVVEVPSASFQRTIQELQARKAKVQPAGTDAPEEAKIKFKLQSQSTGMEQVVYFI